jgi:hypothetical protein
MADDDDHYEIDARGNRVLIGLTAEETEEYIRLDAMISATDVTSARLFTLPWTGTRHTRSALTGVHLVPPRQVLVEIDLPKPGPGR